MTGCLLSWAAERATVELCLRGQRDKRNMGPLQKAANEWKADDTDSGRRAMGNTLQRYVEKCGTASLFRDQSALASWDFKELEAKVKSIMHEVNIWPGDVALDLVLKHVKRDLASRDFVAFASRIWPITGSGKPPEQWDPLKPMLVSVQERDDDYKLEFAATTIFQRALVPLVYEGKDRYEDVKLLAETLLSKAQQEDIFELTTVGTKFVSNLLQAVRALMAVLLCPLSLEWQVDLEKVLKYKDVTTTAPQGLVCCALHDEPWWQGKLEVREKATITMMQKKVTISRLARTDGALSAFLGIGPCSLDLKQIVDDLCDLQASMPQFSMVAAQAKVMAAVKEQHDGVMQSPNSPEDLQSFAQLMSSMSIAFPTSTEVTTMVEEVAGLTKEASDDKKLAALQSSIKEITGTDASSDLNIEQLGKIQVAAAATGGCDRLRCSEDFLYL